MTNRIEKNNKSIIDLLKLQMLPSEKQFTGEFIEELLTILNLFGIGHSNKKPNLRYFKQGYLLFSKDNQRNICGAIKWNGDNQYIQLELTGLGCNYFNAKESRFEALYHFAIEHQGVIKEIDIAVDDFSGKYSQRRFNQDYTQGKFNGIRGTRPKRKIINDDGRKSILIGGMNSVKQCQIYDKSAEQKLLINDPRFNCWTRIEVTLYSRKSGHIPLDCLLMPDSFFVGAYPKVLRKVIKGVDPRCIKREQSRKTACDYLNSVKTMKKQWGKTVNSLVYFLEDEVQVIDSIKRKGMPQSLILPSYLSRDSLTSILKPQLQSLISENSEVNE